jgi:AcrR family transcriptional regulator
MKNTREKILDTARSLFNKLGYSQVTIRMIASEMSISSGNLNYHFKKKEDILEALYFEMVENFDKRVEEVESKTISLELMKEEISTSMQRMMAYRFFWADLYFLFTSSPSIKKHFTEVRKGRLAGYHFVFQQLEKQKVLKEPSFSREFEFLIKRMLDYSNTWLYASIIYPDKVKKTQLIDEATFQLLSLLYPYLTKSGKGQFKVLFPEFFK